jgi:murein DD-endopeptidase MepM/ murein hydrolase activator NlpD
MPVRRQEAAAWEYAGRFKKKNSHRRQVDFGKMTNVLLFFSGKTCQVSNSNLKASSMRKKLFVAALLGLLAAFAHADPNAALTRMADGFDFPIGKPNADGYRISRGFTAHGHLGEDWVGQGGSGTDFRDPVYAIGTGVVTLARDFRRSWGNVIVVRHAFMEEGQVKYADSLYGHLDRVLVREGQQVARGQQIGTIGNAHGLYAPHLHFEVHKNLAIGVVHTMFTGDLSNYYVPSEFVNSHRTLQSGNRVTTVAMNNYVMPTFPGVPALPSMIPAKDTNALSLDVKHRANSFQWSRYDDLNRPN